MQRRVFVLGASAAAIGVPVLAATDPAVAPFRAKVAQGKLNRIEADSGGRLGVCVLDTATGRRLVHRANERFPMCSTFKLLAAAMVLKRADDGQERLDRPIAIERTVILPHSPVTEPNVGGTMTMGQLCDATLTQSDNAAANLMLTSFGGPATLTAYVRSLGDKTTRLDRDEPSLNEAIAGDPRDTTTPAAMVGLARKLLLGSALKPASRAQLRDWMIANKTGGQKIRAGLPPGWQVGDKTGGGAFGTNNDVAIVWPPARAPILVAAYLTQTTAPLAQRDAALAAVAALIPDFIGA